MPEDWPIVFSKDKFSSFLNAKVTNKKTLMIATNQLYTNHFRHV